MGLNATSASVDSENFVEIHIFIAVGEENQNVEDRTTSLLYGFSFELARFLLRLPMLPIILP